MPTGISWVGAPDSGGRGSDQHRGRAGFRRRADATTPRDPFSSVAGVKDRLLGQGTPMQAATFFAAALLLVFAATAADGVLTLVLLICGVVAFLAGAVLLGRRPIRR